MAVVVMRWLTSAVAIEMTSERLKIAVQKSGRLADDSFSLLERCGLRFSRSKDRLFCYGENMPIDVLLVRDDDIPGLLMDGVCDLGIVGENVAAEQVLERKRLGECSDLKLLRQLDFGACRLSLAFPETESCRQAADLNGKRVATSYPRLTEKFLTGQGIQAQIVKLSGSVEIAPSMGTADAIADLVSTGATLRANHLVEGGVMYRFTAQLLQAPASLDAARQAVLDR